MIIGDGVDPTSVEAGRLRWAATRPGADRHLTDLVQQWDREATDRRAHVATPPAPLPAPAPLDPTLEGDALRDALADEYGLAVEHRVFLSGTETELRQQAEGLRALVGAPAPQATVTPMFVPNPGQSAGNAYAPAPSGNLQAGRDLYRNRK